MKYILLVIIVLLSQLAPIHTTNTTNTTAIQPCNGLCLKGGHGTCNVTSDLCICDKGWAGEICTEEDGGMKISLWIVILMIIGVLILERFWNSCKKVYKRRNKETGFQQLGMHTANIGDDSDVEYPEDAQWNSQL